MPSESKPHKGHALIKPVTVEALLADDFELHLVRAPLIEPGTNCQYGACESDEACTCQEAVEE